MTHSCIYQQSIENTNDEPNLTDISNFHIDTSLSETKRLSILLSMLENPYFFKVNNVSVHVGYNSQKTLREIFTNYLLSKR